MDTIRLWTCNGDAVRQAIELGELVQQQHCTLALTSKREQTRHKKRPIVLFVVYRLSQEVFR
jgi:hypothetical protein